MVTRIKTDDETFLANKKNETFVVGADTNLSFLDTSFAIVANIPSGGRTFRIDGSVNAQKDPANGFQIECSARRTEHIVVGTGGTIGATFSAIDAGGGLLDIRVAGRVEGGFSGIRLFTERATLRNSGTIESDTSISLLMAAGISVVKNSGHILSNESVAVFAGGDSTTIINSGSIVSPGLANAVIATHGEFRLVNIGTILSPVATSLFIDGDALGVGNAVILNRGTIAGATDAIVAKCVPSNSALTVINTGDIIGNIDLSESERKDFVNTSDGRVEGDIFTGAGSDRIVLTNAIVTGVVDGGGGDDVYTVSGNGISLIEAVNGGNDTIRATGNVSITLPANFENVVLIGANDTQATGNSLDNILTGNAGNNVLTGAVGKDTLRGGGGRDELIGGTDSDTFIFAKGDGKDVIRDFNIALVGHDFLDLSGVPGITDFDDLIDNHAKDVDGDVVINAGKGDRVVLEGLTVAELRADMFFL